MGEERNQRIASLQEELRIIRLRQRELKELLKDYPKDEKKKEE